MRRAKLWYCFTTKKFMERGIRKVYNNEVASKKMTSSFGVGILSLFIVL